jgi:hypothetical protein
MVEGECFVGLLTQCLQFVHAHLVRLIGVVTLGDPIMVVLEYCEFGSLDGYLKKNDVPDEIKVRLVGGVCACRRAHSWKCRSCLQATAPRA